MDRSPWWGMLVRAPFEDGKREVEAALDARYEEDDYAIVPGDGWIGFYCFHRKSSIDFDVVDLVRKTYEVIALDHGDEPGIYRFGKTRMTRDRARPAKVAATHGVKAPTLSASAPRTPAPMIAARPRPVEAPREATRPRRAPVARGATWSQATLGFRATFEGNDPLAIIAAAQALGWAPPIEGGLFDVDGVELEDGEPLKRMLARARRSIGVHFADYPRHIAIPSLKDPTIARVGNTGVAIDMAKLAAQLATVPFELASFANLHLKKAGEKLPGDPRVSPGPMHCPLGWALAFRGRGHDRLVSRRWLTAGPWKTWTAGDVSVVQLHALDAGRATALKQAAPGYARLATGLLDRDLVYEPKTTGARVQVTAAPTPRELLARATLRTPVAFVFPTEKAARAALPRIWPYGHEVWVKNKRLDTGYAPRDATPAWAT